MSATSTAERIPSTRERAAQGRAARRGAARQSRAQGSRTPVPATRRTDRHAVRSGRPVSRAAARPAPRAAAASPAARRASVPAHTSAAPAASRVHLTRRGRLLLLVLLVGVLLAAFSLGRSASQASPTGVSSAPSAPSLEQVTVQSGESLWTVARRIAPDHDPREVVAQIRRINDLTDPRLQPGQQLLLPAAA